MKPVLTVVALCAACGLPPATASARPMTVQDVTFAKPESAMVKGAGGAAVQYWLIKPPGFDASKKYPVVFLIHGGPQGAWDDAWSYRLGE